MLATIITIMRENNISNLVKFKALQNISNDASNEINLSSAAVVCLTSFLCLVIVISFFGNIIAIIAFGMCQELRTITCYFVVNLCISDLMVAAFSLPFWVSFIYTGWPSRKDGAAYQIWISLDIFCGCFSITNLSLISLERYAFIVHPLQYENLITKKRALKLMAITPVYSFVTTIISYIRMSSGTPELIVVVLLAAYVVPVAVMTYTYGHVFLVTRAHFDFTAEQKDTRKRLLAFVMEETQTNGKKNKDGERDKSASRSIPYDGGIATAQRESSNCYSFMKKLGFGKAKKENKMEQLMLEGIEDWNNYIDCITAPNSKNYQEMGQTESMGNVPNESPDAILPALEKEKQQKGVKTTEKWQGKIAAQFFAIFCCRRLSTDSDEVEEESTPITNNRRQRTLKSWKSGLRAAKAVGLIIGTFVLLWTPFMIVIVLVYVDVRVSFDVVLLAKCLHYSNSAINPILYVILNSVFRKALRKVPAKLRQY